MGRDADAFPAEAELLDEPPEPLLARPKRWKDFEAARAALSFRLLGVAEVGGEGGACSRDEYDPGRPGEAAR